MRDHPPIHTQSINYSVFALPAAVRQCLREEGLSLCEWAGPGLAGLSVGLCIVCLSAFEMVGGCLAPYSEHNGLFWRTYVDFIPVPCCAC